MATNGKKKAPNRSASKLNGPGVQANAEPEIDTLEDVLARADREGLWRAARLAVELMAADVVAHGGQHEEADLMADAGLSFVHHLRGLNGSVRAVATVRAARAALKALDVPQPSDAEIDSQVQRIAQEYLSPPNVSGAARLELAHAIQDQLLQALPARQVPDVGEIFKLLTRLGRPRSAGGLTSAGVADQIVARAIGHEDLAGARRRDAERARETAGAGRAREHVSADAIERQTIDTLVERVRDTRKKRRQRER